MLHGRHQEKWGHQQKETERQKCNSPCSCELETKYDEYNSNWTHDKYNKGRTSTAALAGKYQVIISPQVGPKIKYKKSESITAQWCLLAG